MPTLSVADYLCNPDANVFSIDFTRFKLRDLDTGVTLFEVAKPEHQTGELSAGNQSCARRRL